MTQDNKFLTANDAAKLVGYALAESGVGEDQVQVAADYFAAEACLANCQPLRDGTMVQWPYSSNGSMYAELSNTVLMTAGFGYLVDPAWYADQKGE